MSQDFIAKKVGYASREIANRALQELENLGLITIIPQEHKKPGYTCQYLVSTIFTKELCKKLSNFFKSFRFFNVKYLCSDWLPIKQEQKVTLVNLSLKENLFKQKPTDCNKVGGQFGSGQKNTASKEGSKMSEIVSTPATNRAVDELNLTPWGKIRLRLFEDEVIFYALDILKNAEGIKNPFAFFFKTATKYSFEKRIPLNDKRYAFLKEAYAMPAEAQFVYKEGEENLKGEKVTYKNKSKLVERPYNPEAERCGEISRRKDEEWEENKRIADEKRRIYWAKQTYLEKHDNQTQDNLPF